jgi:hypothetical protein
VRNLFVAPILMLVCGCASIATERMAGQLSMAMLNQDDPEIVRAGAPAYLLLLDSLIAEDPDDPELLLAGARLYGAYASALVAPPGRAAGLTARALNYAERALCSATSSLCAPRTLAYQDLDEALKEIDDDSASYLYSYAAAWTGWIQARSEDWGAIAELPKVQLMLERVVALVPDMDGGRAQLYLAALLSMRPAALGGRPERAREHFEAAIRYSRGHDLRAKVEYARRYARLVFDQGLHDRLLKEVLAADPEHAGLTLSNVIAQREAERLLKDDYF